MGVKLSLGGGGGGEGFRDAWKLGIFIPRSMSNTSLLIKLFFVNVNIYFLGSFSFLV